MDSVIIIKGGEVLDGKIKISGAKNSSLPLMALSLLTSDELNLYNIPKLFDIDIMCKILETYGVKISIAKNTLDEETKFTFKADQVNNFAKSHDVMSKIRGSISVLGPLIARFGEAAIFLPGGCKIGSRPVNLHIEALEKMGAKFESIENYIKVISRGKLKAANIEFEQVSVGATKNILMAASLAEGTTIINNAACEPEVTELANCLNLMGAQIENIGTNKLIITGVDRLHGADYKIGFDRIEAGTYALAAAITGGKLELLNADSRKLKYFLDILEETGCEVTEKSDSLEICRYKDIKPADIVTRVYPGIATDLQACFMSYMSISNGDSYIKETIFENRFMHVSELNKFGANITVDNDTAHIKGVKKLYGTRVKATDLRAGGALILAGLAAEGETIIEDIFHIERGYENITNKLANCGAIIKKW